LKTACAPGKCCLRGDHPQIEVATMKFFVVILMLVMGLIAGCDDRSATARYEGAREGKSESSPATEPRPTTQELLSGEFRRISLAPLPLSAHVPKPWSVKMIADNLYFLRGPTPAGDVQIQIAERASETGERLERLFRAAQRDADAHKNITRVEIRQLGDMKVFDIKRDVTHPPSVAETGSGAAANVPLKFVDWSVTYYVPRGSDFAAYELHFFNLSEDLFNADKAFLQRILDSVTPEQGGLGVTPEVGPPDTGPK
jgi:hypothetical protein